MRAYKKTTLRDGDGDAWVERKEFAAFISNAFFFERLWDVFEDLDTGDDRRIDLPEFQAGMRKLGCALSDEEAATEFAKIDTNGGGQILFKEFCAYVARAVGTDIEAADAQWQEDAADAGSAASVTAGFDVNKLLDAIAPDQANKDLLAAIGSKEAIGALFRQADYNGNGGCSLAELDKLVEEKGWPLSKPTLMRAYKKTTLKDGDGDAWVERKEFPAFMRNAFLFERLWDVFDGLDEDDDRRIDLAEFKAGMLKLGCALSDEEAATEFAKIDTNNGGMVLFKEFCDYVGRAGGLEPVEGDDW